MSGYNDDYSDVLDGDGFQDRQSGSGLRKQLETVLEQNKKLIERLEQADRKSGTETLLKEKGIDPAVAELIPDGANAGEWLDKHGHLFSARLDQANTDTAPDVEVAPDHDAERDALARMDQSSSAGSQVVQQQDPLAQLAAIDNEADMLAFLDRQKGGTGRGNSLF